MIPAIGKEDRMGRRVHAREDREQFLEPPLSFSGDRVQELDRHLDYLRHIDGRTDSEMCLMGGAGNGVLTCARPILPGQVKLPQQLKFCFLLAEGLGVFPCNNM